MENGLGPGFSRNYHNHASPIGTAAGCLPLSHPLQDSKSWDRK